MLNDSGILLLYSAGDNEDILIFVAQGEEIALEPLISANI